MCLQPFSQFCRLEAADQGFLKLWIPGRRLIFVPFDNRGQF